MTLLEPRIAAMIGGLALGTLVFLALVLSARALDFAQFITEVPAFGFDLTYRIR